MPRRTSLLLLLCPGPFDLLHRLAPTDGRLQVLLGKGFAGLGGLPHRACLAFPELRYGPTIERKYKQAFCMLLKPEFSMYCLGRRYPSRVLPCRP